MNNLYLANIKTVISDFDGVLTDNSVIVSDKGNEYVSCSRSDGIGFNILFSKGIHCFILSSEISKIVQHRARKMGVEAFNGVKNKKFFLQKYCKENHINLNQIAYIGNDLNDLEVMKIVGLPICPGDAWDEIKDISKIILNTNGGKGVIREFSSIISKKIK